MPVILLLVLIVFILLGGGGLVLSLVYGVFVLAWAVLPWALGLVALLFVGTLLGVIGKETWRPRRSRKIRPASGELDPKERALLKHGREQWEKTFGPVDKPDPWLDAAREEVVRKNKQRGAEWRDGRDRPPKA